MKLKQSLQTLGQRCWKIMLPLGLKFVYSVDSFYQAFSHVANKPFFETHEFPWSQSLEKNWQLIRSELDNILSHRKDLPNFQDVSPEQLELSLDDNWKTFFFYAYGFAVPWSISQCPETNKLLQQIPGMTTAFFSILGPNKHLPPHRGPYKGVMRYHLGIKIPKPKDCAIRVGNETRQWEEGKSLIFDDTFQHEAWNNSSEDRVVLFVDFIRPMRFPASFINKIMIKLIAYSPFVIGNKRRYLAWEKGFRKIFEQRKLRELENQHH